MSVFSVDKHVGLRIFAFGAFCKYGDRCGYDLHLDIFLAHLIGYMRFYPGIENLILPMLSNPGRQVTSSCEIAS